MQDFIRDETLVVELLVVITLVALVVRRLRIPYTVALVLAGLALALTQPARIDVSPQVILGLFVPPLVFEAAFQIRFDDLRRQLGTVLLLAVPGVILTMLIVGGLVSLAAPLPLAAAMVFGALISATDPVAVVALFRDLGVSRRLAVLVDSESLLNDGTAIVLYNLVLGVALAGRLDLLQSTTDFVRVVAGGTFLGFAAGWLVALLITRIDDYLIETTLTTILAFGSYLAADRLGFSGVLAVVTAGLVLGNIGPRGMSPTSRIVLNNYWENVAFLANSLVFLLIGLQIDLPAMGVNWRPVLWAVLAVLASRIVVVYGVAAIGRRFFEPVPFASQHVLVWGGLRGAISLALALSLPAALGDERSLLRLMTFGVVLFTILVQGTTMNTLIRRLGIARRTPAEEEYELRHGRLLATRAALRHLEAEYCQGVLSGYAWEALRPELEQRIDALIIQARELLHAQPALETRELDSGRREVLRAQRSALLGLLRDGVISQDAYEQLTAEVDAVLVREGSAAAPVAAADDGVMG